MDTDIQDTIDMIFDMFFNTKINTEIDNSLRSPSRRRFLSIGGISGSKLKDEVYIVDLDTKSVCLHSHLPVKMKEVHAYEYNGKLLVCSTYTSTSDTVSMIYTIFPNSFAILTMSDI